MVAAATANKKAAADTARWLTRRQASDLLGVSESTLLSWERRGLLHPQHEYRDGSIREVTIYDPAELARVPLKHRKAIVNAPGEQTARAFELFDQGKTAREVVLDLREAQPRIMELYEQWLDAGGCHAVIPPSAWAEIEGMVGPFKSVAELCERMREKLGTGA